MDAVIGAGFVLVVDRVLCFYCGAQGKCSLQSHWAGSSTGPMRVKLDECLASLRKPMKWR